MDAGYIAMVKLEFIAVVSRTNDMLIKMTARDERANANPMTTRHENLSVINIIRRKCVDEMET